MTLMPMFAPTVGDLDLSNASYSGFSLDTTAQVQPVSGGGILRSLTWANGDLYVAGYRRVTNPPVNTFEYVFKYTGPNGYTLDGLFYTGDTFDFDGGNTGLGEGYGMGIQWFEGGTRFHSRQGGTSNRSGVWVPLQPYQLAGSQLLSATQMSAGSNQQISPDGSNIVILNTGTKQFYYGTFSTPYDPTTVSALSNHTISALAGNPQAFMMNNYGTKMIVSYDNGVNLTFAELTMSTPYDPSTATLTGVTYNAGTDIPGIISGTTQGMTASPGLDRLFFHVNNMVYQVDLT